MKNRAPTKNKPLIIFFLLTFIFAMPSYILVGLASKDIILSPEMAFVFVPLATLAPIGAALVLTFKENGWAGAKKLLGRSFDYKRTIKKIWYLPTLFLLPFLFILAWGVTVLIGQPLTAILFPVVALPVVFVLFFIMALGEEVGWMGYAFEPMQDQSNAAKAALLLGLIWALSHVPLLIFNIADPVLIVAQLLSLVAIRFLIVWLFNNTGKSVFVAILFHTIYNVTISMLPANQIISSLFLMATAIIVTFLWGPETMANFRWKKADNLG
jgi:membrane protease YdiL (CAAX protease family)